MTPTPTTQEQRRARWNLIGPGLIVAATGVGAADLVATVIAGQKYGYALLWAVVVGCLMKVFLVEGAGRYSLATGRTIYEGWASLGRYEGVSQTSWSPLPRRPPFGPAHQLSGRPFDELAADSLAPTLVQVLVGSLLHGRQALPEGVLAGGRVLVPRLLQDTARVAAPEGMQSSHGFIQEGAEACLGQVENCIRKPDLIG